MTHISCGMWLSATDKNKSAGEDFPHPEFRSQSDATADEGKATLTVRF